LNKDPLVQHAACITNTTMLMIMKGKWHITETENKFPLYIAVVLISTTVQDHY